MATAIFWIAPPRPPPWRNPRKGRDQILPSGNLVFDEYFPDAADEGGGYRCLDASAAAAAPSFDGAVDGEDDDGGAGSGAIFSRFSGSMLVPGMGE